MARFVLARLVSAALVALGVVCLVFLFIHLVPGDPVEVMLGEGVPAGDREGMRKALGLDRPLGDQLLHYLQGLLGLDLGASLYSRRPVAELLVERLPATLELTAASLLVALAIALPAGIVAAVRRGTVWDAGATGLALAGMSVPNFVMGPLLILVFAVGLGWFPVSGRDAPASVVLPALTLGSALAGVLSRMVRSALLEVLAEDYVRTARAKGLSALQVTLRHGLPNAALPVVTLLGLQLGALLGGAVITETVFAWPGLGLLTVEAIQRRDYPVLQGAVLLISLGYVLVNTLTDLLYGGLDPRVRLAGRS